MSKLVIGILAHVDAGKTTLSEGILYLTGSIRKLGRVDHKNTFLDTYELERARGITIFSKQAVLEMDDFIITLLDTPGHVDFSTEMERTLQVLDYAILVISGSDGVQGHTETLWRLLKRYQVPTFIFVNKMDLEGTNRAGLMDELKKRLDDGCVDFGAPGGNDEFMESLAMCDDVMLDKYMEEGELNEEDITELISRRKAFPCFFGSALKLQGVEELLEGLRRYAKPPVYPEQFGAKVYKIARDDQGNRLTYMKITGGTLKVKQTLTNQKEEALPSKDEDGSVWKEKVNQIRIYSGTKYEAVEEATAGTICAITGLTRTYPGEGLGIEAASEQPSLQPVLNYQVLLPPEQDPYQVLIKLKQLEEEDPQLHVLWSEHLREIHVQLMGEVQIEVLRSVIQERFGIVVDFSTGNILYKETLLEPVIGVGHFEPLRHYAEVHLLMEPGEPGSGITVASNCSEDLLDKNWQRLIMSHLEEKEHIGVLAGAPVTDIRITLIGGRAHQKHTEGGDFRQATYRAVRQGLKKGKCILLEPYYQFRLELPSETLGKAMTDIQRMSGSFNPPQQEGDMVLLTGKAPVATMRGYQTEVMDYSRGRGRLTCILKGYEPCHNTEEVLQKLDYDSERDPDNPTGSVFCAHGAGFIVPWYKVEEYMHLELGHETILNSIQNNQGEDRDIIDKPTAAYSAENYKAQNNNRYQADTGNRRTYAGTLQEDKELEDIFVRTFGPIKQRINPSQGGLGYEKSHPDKIKRQQINIVPKEPVKEYLLVDGYNIIFSWEELHELAKINMDAARGKLMDILCNYQGYKKCTLILIFDAYKVKGGVGSVHKYHNIHVVYTKEAETADEYIEKVTHEMVKSHHVIVATSDALEQMIILGQGAVRLSAKDLKEEIIRVGEQIRRDYQSKQGSGRSYLKEQMSESLLELLNRNVE